MMMKTTLCRVRALPGTPSVPPARLASTRMVGPQRYRLCPPVRLASTPPHMTIANRRSRSPDVACSASTTGGAPAGTRSSKVKRIGTSESLVLLLLPALSAVERQRETERGSLSSIAEPLTLHIMCPKGRMTTENASFLGRRSSLPVSTSAKPQSQLLLAWASGC